MRMICLIVLAALLAPLWAAEASGVEPATDEATRRLVEGMLAAFEQNVLKKGAGVAVLRLDGYEDDRNFAKTGPQPLNDARQTYCVFQYDNDLSRTDEYFYDPASRQVGDLRGVFVDNYDEVMEYRHSAEGRGGVMTKDGALSNHIHMGSDLRAASMFGTGIGLDSWIGNVMTAEKCRVEELDNGLVRMCTEDGRKYVVFNPSRGYIVEEFSFRSLSDGPDKMVFIRSGTIEWVETSGGWYPRRVELLDLFENIYLARKEQWHIEIQRMDTDVAIDRADFTLDSMRIKPGTILIDWLTGERLGIYREPLDDAMLEGILKDVVDGLGETSPPEGRYGIAGTQASPQTQPPATAEDVGDARGRWKGTLPLLLGVVLVLSLAATLRLRKKRS